jgi:DNA-binding transcriptional ArsR family regulator
MGWTEMDEDIVINRALLKAIGAESRILILKSLADGRKTQSQLAAELGLSSPTIIEHMDQLCSAGLVEKIDEGRKWKYYELTGTGRKLAAPKPGIPVRAMLFLAIGLLFMAFSWFSLLPTQLPGYFVAGARESGATPMLGATMETTNETLAKSVSDAASSAVQQEPSSMLAYAVLGLGIAVFLLGTYELAKKR